jgi:hypothetical protein
MVQRIQIDKLRVEGIAVRGKPIGLPFRIGARCAFHVASRSRILPDILPHNRVQAPEQNTAILDRQNAYV